MRTSIALSIAIFLLSACGGGGQPGGAATSVENGSIARLTAEQISNAGIVTGRMEQRQISSLLKVNGKIDVPPQTMVSISVPLGGYLKSTKLLPGMHVSKGEVIAVMEDQQYIQLQQDYLTAKAKITFLEPEYHRQKELNESKASSDKVFQQSDADYKSQLVLMAALAQKLQLVGIDSKRINENNLSGSINIYSPINGYVSKVNVNIGKYISPTDVMFELINPADIHLALKVFEKDLDKLFAGQELMAYTNNNPEKKYPCEVLLIGRDISAERNTDVHCHFKNYDKTLVPGTYMNAEIELKRNKAFVLPEDAVVRFENKQYAFVKRGEGRFEMLEVHTGDTENGFLEIKDGEKLISNEFVTKGAYSLLMSLKNRSEE